MQEFLPARTVLDDPAFIALVGVSIAFIIVVLSQGLWRYVTGFLIGIVNFAITIAWFYAVLAALMEFYTAISGPPGRRAIALSWGLVMTAFSLIIPFMIGYLNSPETPVGRFVTWCKPERYRWELRKDELE